MILEKIEEGIFLEENISSSLKNIDSIIFDCDGVLIDVKNSYDLAIKKTTGFILKEFANISNPLSITSEIIDGLKLTGGFNDEVDLTYAAIVSLVAAEKLSRDGHKFILEVIRHADQSGISSVDKYLDSLNVDLSDIRSKLNYPASHHNTLLYSVFDQLFYGPNLYSKLFKKNSQFSEKGFIENDNVIVTKELLDLLKKKFDDKIAIVSGRGKESIGYSLKHLLNNFNVKNSAFLEDEPRELAKPNPNPLIRSIKGLDSSNCLYVGDSMEDLLISKKASKMGYKTTFCAIYGTAKFPEQRRRFFEKQNLSIILHSINLLPKVLNLVLR